MLIKFMKDDIENWFDSKEVKVSVDDDSLTIGENELYYRDNDWYILGELVGDNISNELMIFFMCRCIKRKYVSINISGTDRLTIEIGVNDIYDLDEYFSYRIEDEYLIKSIENGIVEFKEVGYDELKDITSGMHSVSSNGLWEDLNGSVCIILDTNWKLNIDLLDNFMDQDTYDYLIDNHYYSEKVLNNLLSDNMHCTEESLEDLLESNEDVVEVKVDVDKLKDF